jgi:hypothetical protein
LLLRLIQQLQNFFCQLVVLFISKNTTVTLTSLVTII